MLGYVLEDGVGRLIDNALVCEQPMDQLVICDPSHSASIVFSANSVQTLFMSNANFVVLDFWLIIFIKLIN